MAISSAERAEIGRQNARKSTGPRTAEGKERARWNAVKHGMTARATVLPGEDAAAFQARLNGWTDNLDPHNNVEEYLAERAARISWQLDRIERAHVARLTLNIEASVEPDVSAAEADEVLRLGRLLFWDRRGPVALYPKPGTGNTIAAPLTSWSGEADDPNEPARILIRLEATLPGCEWLMERWRELRDLLQSGPGWLSSDKLRAIRLAGKQPIDAASENVVAAIFALSHVVNPQFPSPIAEVFAELTPAEAGAYEPQAMLRLRSLGIADDPRIARRSLLSIVDMYLGRLLEKFEKHRRTFAAQATVANELQAFDQSPEGERLRRYETSCTRLLLRTLGEFRKMHGPSGAGADVGADVFNDCPPIGDDAILRNEASDAGIGPAERMLHEAFPCILRNEANDRTGVEPATNTEPKNCPDSNTLNDDRLRARTEESRGQRTNLRNEATPYSGENRECDLARQPNGTAHQQHAETQRTKPSDGSAEPPRQSHRSNLATSRYAGAMAGGKAADPILLGG